MPSYAGRLESLIWLIICLSTYGRAKRRGSRAPYQLGLSNNSTEEHAHIPAFTMAGNLFSASRPFSIGSGTGVDVLVSMINCINAGN